MSQSIVIIGASELQLPLILKAKEMGFETHAFAWKTGAVGETVADYFYPISITEKEQILDICQRICPVAVLTIASELGNITANYLCHKLGLLANSERCVYISTNKFAMREAFFAAKVDVPRYKVVDSYDSCKNVVSGMKFPIIVKPTDRSGSRGITKLISQEGLSEAITSAIDYSIEKKAIIEEFIEGDEFSCECISYNGKHKMLAITKKYTTGAPHFIETGHIEPSGLDAVQSENIRAVIFRALDALDIRVGASHSEFKIDAGGNVRIIEIGSRMGGDCIGSDLVKLSTGYDFLKMTIEAALGKQPDETLHGHYKNAAVKFIISHSDFEIMEKIQNKFPNIIKYVSKIEIKDHGVVDSSTRYGFYIMASDDRELLESVL